MASGGGIKTKVDGVWKEAQLLLVKVGGVWMQAAAAYVKIDGRWALLQKEEEHGDDYGPDYGRDYNCIYLEVSPPVVWLPVKGGTVQGKVNTNSASWRIKKE